MAESDVFSFVKEEEYELILGNSLSNKRSEQDSVFHTVRYDFKPASIDSTKPGSLAVGNKNDVTVEVPHIQDSGSTTYNGSKRLCQKEFLLIVDKKSQTLTLERIESNMQVKKIRSQSSKRQETNAKIDTKSKSPEKEPNLTASPSSLLESSKMVAKDSSSDSSDISSDSDDENRNISDNEDDDDDDDDDDEIDEKHVEQLNNFLNFM
ncbi:ELL-associated factor 2 [Exaiptasia diaphana]|uniref:Transcription elongation factor Eaf N-terminal domain-containing protein n=1 Tax=Exaiptasia diaphana TaxID=2652724 RepID=A0A913XUT1_EXADI|nr:ELL-associated factor 2 [Exaiptasia diaphana]